MIERRQSQSGRIAVVFAAAMLITALPVACLATVAAHAEATATAVHPDDPYAVHITEAAQRFGIFETWIRAVMHAKGAGIAQAVSPKGAMGLMQIMPGTWDELRARYGLGSDPFEPRDNILAGAAYMRELLDRYGSPDFLAAYNAGPARYEEYLTTARPLSVETQNYVKKLAPLVGALPFDGTIGVAGVAARWVTAPLFVNYELRTSNGSPGAMPAQPERHLAIAPAVGLSAIVPRSDGLFVHSGKPGEDR